MGVILALALTGVFIFLLFYVASWMDSDNSIKQNIGCTFAAILVGVVVIIGLIGSCKTCIDDHSGPPSYDYYDAPRK